MNNETNQAAELNAEKAVLFPGQVGTYSGFRAVVVRHYFENMYEVRVPGGIACICDYEFIAA